MARLPVGVVAWKLCSTPGTAGATRGGSGCVSRIAGFSPMAIV